MTLFAIIFAAWTFILGMAVGARFLADRILRRSARLSKARPLARVLSKVEERRLEVPAVTRRKRHVRERREQTTVSN